MPDKRAFAEEGESPYAMLFEAAPDATIVVNDSGEILLANHRTTELFGWSREELVGSKVERLIPPRFARGHEQRRHGFNAKPRPRAMGNELELFGLRADGSEFPLEIALSPFELKGRRLVAASIRDLTDTLRFKEAAKRARYSSQVVRLGELALRAKGLDEFLAAVPDIVVEALRTDIVVVYWADSGSGLQPRVIHGLPDSLLDSLEIAIAALEKELLTNDLPRVITDYRNEAGIIAEIAEKLQLGSGLRVPLHSARGPVGMLVTHSRQSNLFGAEEVHFMQAVGNVIVEAFMRGEVEEQLAHAQRLESIGQLTGGIAHDFNNILTVVLGNLQMLREALAQGENAGFVKLVDSAHRASRRGADLTQKLLTFSRKQALAPTAVNAAETLSALVDMLARTIGEAIKIEWRVADDCPAFLADGTQLDNAIVNLILNARDAMPEGGSMRLHAAAVRAPDDVPELAGELAPGDYVAIGVADSGRGMPPEVLRRAYEPFFTTKPSGKGSGLGLSMVFGFAKQSRGTVRIVSEPGQGTEVTLYFPSAGAGVRAGAGLPVPRVAPESGARQETILAVDDDVEVLNLAESMLVRAGYRVLRAVDSAKALQWLAGPEDIALLFTDVVLGNGETGPKLAEKALTLRPKLPILYTSGYVHGSLSVAEVQPIQFLPKPYQAENLIARVEILLAEAAARK